MSAAPQFDWTLMRSFLAVIEHGSLLGAARELRSSQPTLGRHVAQLERQLGATLFERTGRGLVPTRSALAIAGHARAMDAGADAIARTLAQEAQRTEGTVRIGASQVVATFLLPPLLAELRRREPGIEIELVASNAISNLLRREADIALRMVRPDQASLIARRIAKIEVGAYASKAYLKRRGLPSRPADLLAHDLIGFDSDESIVRGFRALGVAIARERFVFRCDDHVVNWQAVRAGLGIGFAAGYVGDADPAVRRVLPQLAIPPLPVWLTVHREIRSSRRIRAVYDFLAAAIPEAPGIG